MIRTETGALLRRKDKPDSNIDIGEWLDFVRALYKSGVNEWERNYGDSSVSEFYGDSVSKFDERWKLEIYYSDKAGFRKIEGYDAYPPNWGEFMRIMDGMKVKFTQQNRRFYGDPIGPQHDNRLSACP